MSAPDLLAKEFEAHRAHLRGVAYRMLGSLSDAEDAVQDAWLRVSSAGTEGVDNLGGWLTTIVARVCLNMLRSRETRREDPLENWTPDTPGRSLDPQQEAQLADSVGLALLVVLNKLEPAERLAFVLHDMFDLPFEAIAQIVDKSPDATRQLASRARRRVRGSKPGQRPDRHDQEIVDAFLEAGRRGDMQAVIALLDPDVELRGDRYREGGGPSVVRGAQNVLAQASRYGNLARFAQALLINGAPGLVVAPKGRLLSAVLFTIKSGRIVAMESINDPARLAQLELAVPER